MLSDALLADIARQCPTQTIIVSAAWPSLSVESRLQVISAVTGHGLTPDWLLDLAMQDSAAIVRYWAARNALFRKEGPIDFTELEKGNYERMPATPADLARFKAALTDQSDLVRLSLDRLQFPFAEKLNSIPQQQRLLGIRNSPPSFGAFIAWLAKAIEEPLSDDDLAACSSEFFAHPKTLEAIEEKDYEDGGVAHAEGKALEQAWALLKGKAGPQLTATLTYALPLERGLFRLKAQDLAEMPDHVVRRLLFRQDEGGVLLELADLIHEQRDRFPAEIVEALDQDYLRNPEAKAQHRLRNALDRQSATIDAILAMQRDLSRLRERVDEVYDASTRRRRFFG
jgi:hypothetical protein